MTENGQRIKLLRLYELLRRETDEDHPISRMDLCQRLNDMGILCIINHEKKTTNRDLTSGFHNLDEQKL